MFNRQIISSVGQLDTWNQLIYNMSLTYEKKFFKNFAAVLLEKEPELMTGCRAVAAAGLPGCVHVVFTTISDFAKCRNASITYMPMDQLQRLIKSTSVDWNGYTRLSPEDNFVMAMTTPDLDGRPIHKTIGVKDDGGPPDVSEIALYPKIAFVGQCNNCSRSTMRRRLVCSCEVCGETPIYCSVRCRDVDYPHHATLEHAI